MNTIAVIKEVKKTLSIPVHTGMISNNSNGSVAPHIAIEVSQENHTETSPP